MGNRIDPIFESGGEVLSIYCTAGYPKLDDTVHVVKAIEEAGAQLVEIGIPFSDPLADGPVIQASSQRALENGMSLSVLFEQLKDLRATVSLPLILMGYINPVLRYGFEEFCAKCEEVGVDGTIIPDLPLEEYVEDYKEMYERYGLYNICLITPQTSAERIRYIDSNTKGFVYMVSTQSTTGGSKHAIDSRDYFERVRGMQLSNPTLIGFNIHDRDSFRSACEYSNGGIIGSAFVKALGNSDDVGTSAKDFIKSIR